MWDRYWNIRDNLGEYGTDLELGDSNDWDGSLRGCGGSDDLTYIYTGIIRPWYETPDATNQDGDGPVNMYPFCNEDRNNGDMNAQEVDYNGDGNIDSDECSIDLRDYIQITVNGAQIDPADIELSLSPPHFGCGGNPDCGVDGKIFIMTFTVAADVPDSATAQCQVQGNEKVAAGPLKLEGVNFARGLFGLNDFSTLPDNVGYCFPSKPFMTFIALGAGGDDSIEEKLAAGTETSEGSMLLGVHGLASATLADGAGDASDTVSAPLIDPPFGQETCELLTATETIAEFAATVDGFVTKDQFTEAFDAIVFENEIQNPVADVSANFAGYSTTTSSSFQGIDQSILDTLAADRDILHFQLAGAAVGYSVDEGGSCDVSHASFTVRDDALLFSITVSTGNPDRSSSSEGCFETLENIDGMPECGQSCGWNWEYCDDRQFFADESGSCDWENPVCSYQCFQAPTTFGDYMTTGMPNRGPGIMDAIMHSNCGTERCDEMRSVAEQFDWSTVTLGPMRTTTTAKFFAKTITDSSDDANAIMASFGDTESWPTLVNDIVALEVIDPPISSSVTATPGRLAGISGVSGTALLPAPLPPASAPAPPIWETVYQWDGDTVVAPPPPPPARTYQPPLSID